MGTKQRGPKGRLLVVVLAVVWSALAMQHARALGLGDVTVKSVVNEPLSADIALLNVGSVGAAQVLVSLASPEDYERVGVERDFFHTQLQFKADIAPNAADGVIHVTSSDKVVEPFLNFLVDVRWPTGRILREYTLLLDLPVYSKAPVQPTPAAVVAPATAPAAPAPGAAPQSLSGQYEVSANDTLWGIASRSRPEGRAAIFQMMIAIQQRNPQAFLHNNINLLRAGAMLDIPTEDQALAISSGESQAAVREQTEQWREGAETPSQPLTASGEIATPEAAGADYEGHLRLAAGEGAAEGSSDAVGEQAEGTAAERIERLRGALASTSEELDVARRENADLQQRIALLEQQLQTSEELDSLKAGVESDELAAVATALTVAEDAATGAVTDNAAADDGANTAAPEPGDVAPASETVAQATAEPEAVAAEGGSESAAVFPWRGLAIGGGVLLLLAALVAWRRRSAYVDFDFEAEAAAPVRPAEPAQPGARPRARDTMATLDKAFEHFERGEADTARAMLQAAIDKEPHRSDLRLGLLQMLASSGDNDGVERQFAALQAIATPEELERAEAFLARAAAVKQQVSRAVKGAGRVADLEQELADVELSPASAPARAEVASVAAADTGADAGWQQPESLDAGQGLDLDIDLGDFEDFEELQLADSELVDGEPALLPADAQQELSDFADLEPDVEQQSLDLPEISERELNSNELGNIFEEEAAAADIHLDTGAGQDEVATKLELAEAYIDMDDYDAAREILREVIADGSPQQQSKAREMMGAIA